MSSPVGRAVFLYGCAFAVAGATPFLLLPFLTARLTPSQFGEVTSFLILAALCGNIAGLSASGFASVRFFKSNASRFAVETSSAILLIAIAHGIALLATAAASATLVNMLGIRQSYLYLAVGTAFMSNVGAICLAIFQSSARPGLYLTTRGIQALVEIAVCLALLKDPHADAGARIGSYAAGVSAGAALGLIICLRMRRVSMGADRRAMGDAIGFGVPMIPHIVAGTSISYIDRVIVSSRLGSDSLGIYMVAMQVGMAMLAIIEPLNKALAPWLFSQLSRDSEDLRRAIVRRTYQLFAALILAGVGLWLMSQWLFHQFIASEFADAKSLIPWMIGGFAAQGMYYGVVNYMFYAERTGLLSLVSGTSAVCGGLLSYVLVSTMGIAGAGMSFLMNNLLLFLLVWLVASRIVPMPWRAWR